MSPDWGKELHNYLVHALDHAARLAETAREKNDFRMTSSGPDDTRVVELCIETMRDAAAVAEEIAALPARPDGPSPTVPARDPAAPAFAPLAAAMQQTLARFAQGARTLEERRHTLRGTTLAAVAAGSFNADDAIARVDKMRCLDMLAHHAWRSAAYLVRLEDHGD